MIRSYYDFLPVGTCFASAGDDNNTDPGNVGGGNDSKQPDWASFVGAIEKLSSEIPAQINRELGGRLDGLTTTVREASTPQQEPEAPPDFESMTQGEMAGWMQSFVARAIKEQINAALEPFANELVSVKTDLISDKGVREINRLRTERKDYADWKEEMIALQPQHSTLGFEDLYILARGRNAEKAKQLDAKYNPPVEKPRPFAFTAALAPGARGNNQPSVLTKSDASLEAAREVANRNPGVLRALQDL